MRQVTVIAAAALLAALALFVTGCDRGGDQRPISQAPASQLMNFDKEKNALETILREDPENLNALIRMGNIYMDTKRFNEAIDAYGRALEIDPSNPDVRVDMGTCYRNTGRSDKAVEEYRKALTYDPNHLNAYMNLGVVLAYDLGDRDGAIAEFEKFVELAPSSPNAPAIRQEIQRLKDEAAQGQK